MDGDQRTLAAEIHNRMHRLKQLEETVEEQKQRLSEAMQRYLLELHDLQKGDLVESKPSGMGTSGARFAVEAFEFSLSSYSVPDLDRVHHVLVARKIRKDGSPSKATQCVFKWKKVNP